MFEGPAETVNARLQLASCCEKIVKKQQLDIFRNCGYDLKIVNVEGARFCPSCATGNPRLGKRGQTGAPSRISGDDVDGETGLLGREKRMQQISRNEKAVKCLKTNNLAKSLIRRSL